MRVTRSGLLMVMFLLCAASAASAQTSTPALAPAPKSGPAQTSGPAAGYELKSDYTEKSPDGTMTIEEYAKDSPDGGYTWQFWLRRGDTMGLIASDDNYPAGFRFTNDSQWVIRFQKAGAGYSDLYLYKLGPSGFTPATKKSLSDLAWAFFYSRPESHKHPRPNLHIAAGLVKGVVDNYKSLGENWPDNRYLVIGLSGELDPTAHHGQTTEVNDWRCRYDLKTGKFDVPPDFAANNKKALIPHDLSKG